MNRIQRLVPLVLALLIAGAVWMVGRGPGALLYPLAFAALTLPGLPLGFALFGSRQPAGWLAGFAIGYGVAILDIWIAMISGGSAGRTVVAATLIALAITVLATRRSRRSPAIALAPWTPSASIGLAAVLTFTLALAVPPLANVGARDADGNLRYRAYFTADFVWHTALTAELTRFTPEPTNPYLSPEPIHYYWGYFLVPASIARSGPAPLHDVERALRLNALLTGMILMSAIFLAAFAVVRHAFGAAAGTVLALVASSLEGLYELSTLWSRHRSFDAVRFLNIDALTAWDFSGHRIDGLQRCLWYVPQHSMAYALGLIALIVAASAGGGATLAAIVLSGLALGGATLLNPFVGGVFSIVWGLSMAIGVVRRRGVRISRLLLPGVAAVPVALAVIWCISNRMIEGAGGALEFGVLGASRNRPFLNFFLSFGPVLIAALAGLALAVQMRVMSALPAVVLAAISIFLMHYVRLNVDHEWVPFRAGQMLLAAFAMLSAVLFAAPATAAMRRAAIAAGLVLLLAGAPTTIIDAYDAQDIDNAGAGPGFHWTLILSPEQQAAFAWIRAHTLRSTLVQMEPVVRGRDSWSMIPSFAQRQMAAGLPISLLHVPAYDERSALVKGIYANGDAAEAARVAHSMRISYLYVDVTDRNAYPGVAKFDASPQYFQPVFRAGDVGVYQVR